jgi:adenylate cyclase
MARDHAFHALERFAVRGLDADEKGVMTAKILVVDDEPDFEDLVRQKFRRQIKDGSIVFGFARDGVEALALLANKGDFDMVVSDINMPHMDGLTLLAKRHCQTKFYTAIWRSGTR